MDISIFSIDSLVKLVSEFVEIFGIVGAVAVPFVLAWIWINWRTFYPKSGVPDECKALERRREWIAARRFEDRYLRLLDGLLGGITHLTHDAESIEDPRNTAGRPVRWFGLNPFTEGSYLLCLRLALIYPLLGVFVVWLLGGEGALAGITLLPADEPMWWRVLAVVWLGAINFAVFKHIRSKHQYRTDHVSPSKSGEEGKQLSYRLALALAFLAFVFAGAVTVASAGAVALAGVVVGIFANAGAVSIAGAVSGVSTVAVAVAVTLAGAVSTVPAGAATVGHLEKYSFRKFGA